MASPERPNLLLIMADQHRFDFLGCAGAPFVRTPNIDRLAARGMQFTHCCTNSPICAPARIALATGLQPTRTGALKNTSYLPRRIPTYYQHLRDHGYRVGCAGKLDLAKPDRYNGLSGDRPCSFMWGFTHPYECEGKAHAATSATPIGPYTKYLQDHGLLQKFYDDYRTRNKDGWIRGVAKDSVLPTEHFEDSFIGRHATNWIKNVSDEFPWHYFVSFVGPHDPFDPPTEYADRYRNASIPPAIAPELNSKPGWLKGRQKKATADEILVARRQYCASIELIDDQIGKILDVLEQRKMWDNTYVVFSSDHGEMLGDHGLFTKHVAYEASLRVPLIVAGPGIAAGKTSDALVELIDINPTLCELAGTNPQDHIDARSFAPLLRNQAITHRDSIISAEYNYRCYRTDRYKLIENSNDMSEVYDLQTDPHELNNLAESDPALLKSLTKGLADRFNEGGWMR
jgi:arylsulfatase